MNNRYRTIASFLSIATLIALTLIAGCDKSAKRDGYPLMVNAPAPEFEIPDTGGKEWSLEDLRGKVVFINFWATWCPSCVAEMPSINNLNILSSGADGFQILTVLYQDSPENAAKYFLEQGFGMPILVDKEGKVARMYGLTGIPETFIVDKKGVLRYRQIGPRHFDSPDIIQYLNELLAEPA